jgi:protein-S-isoprenylcysteine O-methyltransferase Ste14
MNQNTLKQRKGEHPYGDAGQLVMLTIFAVVWVTDSFFLHATTFLSSHVPNYICNIIMILLVALALWLFFSSRVVIRGERPSELVTSRAFRYVRHPLYLAAMFGYLAAAISSLSLASLALLVPIFIFYNYIATYEERLLEIKFGERYKAYEKRTGKWLPRIP